MKTVFRKIICFFFAISIVVSSAVYSVSCSAEESTKEHTAEKQNQKFKITLPRIIAAGSATVLFTASQIIIKKRTSGE